MTGTPHAHRTYPRCEAQLITNAGSGHQRRGERCSAAGTNEKGPALCWVHRQAWERRSVKLATGATL